MTVAERSRGQLMMHYSFTNVFSEALDAPGTKLMDFTCIARSVFLDLISILLLQIVKFCEFDRRENEAANLFVSSIMVLIDRD